MNHTNLTCANCGIELNNAFVGKANDRRWTENSIVCSTQCGEQTHDPHIMHVLPAEA